MSLFVQKCLFLFAMPSVHHLIPLVLGGLLVNWTHVHLHQPHLEWTALAQIQLHKTKTRKRTHLKKFHWIHKKGKSTKFDLSCINPFHPKISMHILQTVLYTFHKALTRRICLTVKSWFSWCLFPLFFWP